MGTFGHVINLLNIERLRLRNQIDKGDMIMGKVVPPERSKIQKYHETLEALKYLRSIEQNVR